MKVSVRNARDRMLVYLLKLAADSFAKNLMSPQLTKHLSIKIVVRDKLDAGGFCDYEIDPAGNPSLLQLLQLLHRIFESCHIMILSFIKCAHE